MSSTIMVYIPSRARFVPRRGSMRVGSVGTTSFFEALALGFGLRPAAGRLPSVSEIR